MRALRPLLLWIAFWMVLFAPFGAARAADQAENTVDRTTPRRSYTGFVAATQAGDFERAATYLDLRTVPKSKQATDGPELARDLAYVLERRVSVDPALISDEQEAGDPKGTVTVVSLTVEEDTVPIQLSRVHFPDGATRWVFAKTTVTAIPELDAAFGPNPLEERMPKVLRTPYVLGLAPWQWIGLLVLAALTLVLGRVLVALVRVLARRILRVHTKDADRVALAARAPATIFLAVLGFRAAVPRLDLTLTARSLVGTATTLVLIFAVAWLSIRLLAVVAVWLLERAMTRDDDAPPSVRHGEHEVKVRALRTQLLMLHRVASIAIAVIGVATGLLQFDTVRSVGTSLLASAGIAGIVIGLAAQKSIGALIAGIQISVAQPVRIGDTVVVDDHQGVVEEIHLTYVVLRMVDDRRLIAPISRFLDHSFEDWTRVGTELKGAVVLRVDFATPVDVLREELTRICKASPSWDGRACSMQVIDSDATSLSLRARVSATDADALWDLTCEVREKMAGFVSGLEGGRYLVKIRSAAPEGAVNAAGSVSADEASS